MRNRDVVNAVKELQAKAQGAGVAPPVVAELEGKLKALEERVNAELRISVQRMKALEERLADLDTAPTRLGRLEVAVAEEHERMQKLEDATNAKAKKKAK